MLFGRIRIWNEACSLAWLLRRVVEVEVDEEGEGEGRRVSMGEGDICTMKEQACTQKVWGEVYDIKKRASAAEGEL